MWGGEGEGGVGCGGGVVGWIERSVIVGLQMRTRRVTSGQLCWVISYE